MELQGPGHRDFNSSPVTHLHSLIEIPQSNGAKTLYLEDVRRVFQPAASF